LVELRAEMRAMLGAGAAGTAPASTPRSSTRTCGNAQTLLYWTHDWAHLRRYETKTIGMSRDAHRLPDHGEPRPHPVCERAARHGLVAADPEGHHASMYTYQSNPSWPQRWEPYEQMEFWPITDQIYSLRIFFIKALDRFTQDTDRATVDDTAIGVVATSR
jgi:hypothetical protein